MIINIITVVPDTYDPNRNALTFYRRLTSAEKARQAS